MPPAMEPIHVDRIHGIIGDPDRRGRGAGPHPDMGARSELRLLTDFDPTAERGSGVPDPWYGPDRAFDDTVAAVQAAMPGIVAEVRARLLS